MPDKETQHIDKKTTSAADRNGHFAELGKIVTGYLNAAKPSGKKNRAEPVPPPVYPKLRILALLKPIPWILTGLFLFSFVWDFNGITLQLFETPLHVDGLLRIISVSGMIGFLTNWIAITMLFRPLVKRPLLGQGLIPAHKERIAYRLAFAVTEDLVNPELIKQNIRESQVISRYREQAVLHITDMIEKPAFREDLKKWILNYVSSVMEDSDFRNTLARHLAREFENALQDNILEKAALKAWSFLRGQSTHQLIEETLTRLPLSVERNIDSIEEFLDELPRQIHHNSHKLDELITGVLYKLINQIDIHNLVEENLKKYDEQKLERMIRNATNEQLKTIQYLGAVLGTIGGFVIWQPVLSIGVLSVAFGSIYLIDRLLYKW